MPAPTITPITPITLESSNVRLIPLSLDHTEPLAEAARDGELWNLWYTSVPHPGNMRAELERRLTLQQSGSMLPFTVLDPTTNRAVGMTTYMNIDPVTPRLEIGSTWYARSVQRTVLNTAAKLLLLTHAFETLECTAVEFRTHFLNHQSRRAIERLGAKLDGILRSHSRATNATLRDTCVYSVIAPEWPTIKTHLQWLLTKPRT